MDTHGDDDQKTMEKYLELKPRDVNIMRIFRVLSFTDVEDCEDLIESENANEAIFEGRWVIFLSMLAQKVLQYNEIPLLMVGSTFEMCLNVVADKSNFIVFLKNLLRGKVEVPPKTSARFLSILGRLDNRVELDKNIKPGSNRYFASLSAMASKLAYENDEFIQVTVEKTWKMEFLGAYSFWDDKSKGYTTQAFMFHDKNSNPERIILAFRGTEPFNAYDWSTDCDISWCKLQGIKGRVHSGFLKALGGLNHDEIWLEKKEPRQAYDTLTEELNLHFKINHQTRFIITGHSLGGALAVLFPALLATHNEVRVLQRLEAIYTFGQPKVGDEEFGRFMEGRFSRYNVGYYRYVYGHDIVPRLPFHNPGLMYKHFGTCFYINSLYEVKLVKEEELEAKNYLEWCASIVSDRVDALWEVVRGFLLPPMFGQDYEEPLLLQMFRIMGIFFPGLSSHGLRDYINATRIGIIIHPVPQSFDGDCM